MPIIGFMFLESSFTPYFLPPANKLSILLLGVCTKPAKGQVEEHEIGMDNFSFLAVLHSSSWPQPQFYDHEKIIKPLQFLLFSFEKWG